MAETPEIAEFLTARYDEEQQLAEDASRPGMGAEWHAAGTGADGRFVAEATQGAGSWGVARFSFAAQGAHAIYWDPARALADIAAKRKLVELHPPHPNGTCDACARWTDVFECYHVQHPCPTLKVLAAPYADHADFNPDWRVTV